MHEKKRNLKKTNSYRSSYEHSYQLIISTKKEKKNEQYAKFRLNLGIEINLYIPTFIVI